VSLDPHTVALGRAVRTFREAEALSPEELAERAELTLDALAEVEAGEVEARWGDLRRISYGLRVQLSQLMALGEKFADRM
jgi:transcriptional regulator with XRE-family HTH domain